MTEDLSEGKFTPLLIGHLVQMEDRYVHIGTTKHIPGLKNGLLNQRLTPRNSIDNMYFCLGEPQGPEAFHIPLEQAMFVFIFFQ
jgi:hypothetical protein